MWRNRVFDAAHAAADRIAKQHPLYTPVCRLPELVEKVTDHPAHL